MADDGGRVGGRRGLAGSAHVRPRDCCSLGMHTYQDKMVAPNHSSQMSKWRATGTFNAELLHFPAESSIQNTVFTKFTLCSPHTDHVIMYCLVLPPGATDDLTDLQGPNNPFH
jgi:hypothetical protein